TARHHEGAMLPIAVFTTISLRRRPKRLDVPRRTQCNFIQIRYCASIRPLRMSVLSTPTMDLSKLEFAGTVWELINKGRLCPLIAYLRSDKPLAPSDRDSLADLLQGKLKRRIGSTHITENRRWGGKSWKTTYADRAKSPAKNNIIYVGACSLPVCTENLNPNIVVMKPAEDRV